MSKKENHRYAENWVLFPSGSKIKHKIKETSRARLAISDLQSAKGILEYSDVLCLVGYVTPLPGGIIIRVEGSLSYFTKKRGRVSNRHLPAGARGQCPPNEKFCVVSPPQRIINLETYVWLVSITVKLVFCNGWLILWMFTSNAKLCR